jgi:hypothetical protein
MKKIVRLTESDLTRLVKKVINEKNMSLYENVDDEILKLGDKIEEKPIPELTNKTVLFQLKCGNISDGKQEFGIKKATHMTMKSLDGTARTITLELYKIDDKSKNSFIALYSLGLNVFMIDNFSLDNYAEKISLLCKSALYGSSVNIINYIKSLKKYPIGINKNEVIKSKTDF